MAAEAQSIEAEMAEDWAKIQEKYAVEPEPETPASAETSESTSAVEPETAERARDESGKFVKADPAKALSREPVERTAKGPVGEPATALPPTDSVPERDITRAPSTWKPTARAEWEKLPPTVRTEIHRRESDFLNGQSQLLPDAKLGKAVGEIVAPYRMLIEAEGGTPERAIADLMRTAAIFRVGSAEQKLQTLAGIARQFSIDLTPLLSQQPASPGAQSQSQQPLQDPRVDQLLQQMNQERLQRQQAEQAGLESAVTNWMNEKDSSGNPARPYLGDVMGEMGALVPQIRQSSPSLSHEQVLQQAYDRAIWGNPEIRTLLQQQQAQGRSEAERTENQNRVREAKRAASVNVPRRASTPSPGKPGSLEETIKSTARELGLIT